MGVDQCYRVRDREGFQLVGVSVKPGGSSDLVKTDNGSLASMETKADISKSDTSFMKRKRGRPPKGQNRTTRSVSKKKEEEDVCFICFDGGSLVLCDRRGCPKAYHPSCIKRDAAFFRSRAKWTCGWHICSKCQKAAHYMCYTCTYSLCKGCTKGADYVSVRGNFGFCGTCMRTIMLIENSPQGNKEKCEVDFDDKTSWEYLFKVYWVYLKNKLSLTLDELNQGQSSWKGDLIMGSTGETYSILNHERHENCSVRGSSCLDIETNDSKRRKTIDHWKSIDKEDSTCIEELGIDKMPSPDSGNWESNELLETNNSETRKIIDHQNSVSKEARYIEKLGVGKKMHLPISTNWETRELLKTKDSKRRKTIDHRNSVGEDSTYIEKLCIDEKMGLPESKNWASKELLEFVGHVKNGDTSVLSQYGVQALLLEYIDKNKLSDPCRESEILCDAKLKNLFGRASVSQIEVPNLLKSHFLIEECNPGEINLNMRSLDSAADHGETNGLSDSRLMLDIDKRHGPCKAIAIQVSQNDLNVFEAIDGHIIKLIYLRRKQMENLVEDADTFHQKVVGSIVRIKIPNGDRKTDKYRLVLVVGTREVAQQYKIGIRTTDVMLEIVNVNKKEVISIDGISNQEFSEDECRRFCRSIKTGLSKFLNVCDIQERETILQAIRVNNRAETLQPNHLHDRPSEKGYKKEPRESAKILLLSNSGDEQQQLHEIPAVQSDHKMDRDYRFDDDDPDELKEKMTDDNFRSNSSDLNRDEREYLSPRSTDYDLNDVGTGVNETSAASYDQVGRKSSPEMGMILTAQGTSSSDCWGSKCTFDSISKTLQMTEEIDFFELPSLEPKPNNVLNSHACHNKESPSSWSTASSLVSDPVSYPEAVECTEYSPMPTPLSVKEWDCSPVRPKKIAIDHVVTPSSMSCQHPQSSPSKPSYNESNWQVIINDSNDFSFDESVSDLLAEVEAMESRGGVDSPTSIVNHGEEFTDASRNDCLSSAEKLSPLPDPGKGDALSSTADAQLTMFSTFTKEQHVGHQEDILQCQRMTSAQSGIGARKTDFFVQQKEASGNISASLPSTTIWEVAAMDMPWRLGSDFPSTMWGTTQGNVNLGWSSLAEGNSNMNWGLVEGAMQESGGRIISCSTAGNPGIWGSQTRSANDRISSKDQNFHGRDYGSDWGRSNWNRQPISDMVNETASQRHAPKGQATCKYCERGFCNKGGSCSHWHP